MASVGFQPPLCPPYRPSSIAATVSGGKFAAPFVIPLHAVSARPTVTTHLPLTINPKGVAKDKGLSLHVEPRKLAPRYIGPFGIVKVINPSVMNLKLTRSRATLHFMFPCLNLFAHNNSNY